MKNYDYIDYVIGCEEDTLFVKKKGTQVEAIPLIGGSFGIVPALGVPDLPPVLQEAIEYGHDDPEVLHEIVRIFTDEDFSYSAEVRGISGEDN